jgi:hypothetical protein
MGDKRAMAGPAEDEECEMMATADKAAAAIKDAGEAAVGSLAGDDKSEWSMQCFCGTDMRVKGKLHFLVHGNQADRRHLPWLMCKSGSPRRPNVKAMLAYAVV